jgi:geranylgeranyl transferase type-2 subunit alpha
LEKLILLSLITNLFFCSKIGKLTLARLLTARDALMSSDKPVHSEEVLRLYSELMKLDPPHSRFYKDEHSLVLLEKVNLPL